MLDLRPVRDAINEALADAPIAATWLYTTRSDDQPRIHIAVLPHDACVPRLLSKIGDELSRTVGTDAFIANMREMAPPRAQDLMSRAVLINDRDADARLEFQAALALRREENVRRAAELETALDELRVAAMLRRASRTI